MKTKNAFFMILGLVLSQLSFADAVDVNQHTTDVQISTLNNDLPADDLVQITNGVKKILSQQDAFFQHSRLGLDLSTLEPATLADRQMSHDVISADSRILSIWQGSSTSADSALDQSLDPQPNESFNFSGSVQASKDNFKMVVQSQLDNTKSLTLQLSTTAHNLLLRREILRRLGYSIGPMRLLGQVRVQFATSDIRDDVLNIQIPNPNNTDAAAVRWCYANADVIEATKNLALDHRVLCQPLPAGMTPLKENEILFQDVVAQQSTPVFYNITGGPPLAPNDSGDTYDTLASQSRALRALGVIYALVNVPESLNQLEWNMGKLDDQVIHLDVPEALIFGTTLDDAKWILRRLALLNERDFAQIVDGMGIPTQPAKLLTQKLISRRNSLMNLFSIQTTALPFDVRISDGPTLVKGKLKQTDWPGYATRFAHDDAQSPLHDLQYYFYSLLESNIIGNAVNEFNNKLPSIAAANGISAHEDHFNAQFLADEVRAGHDLPVPFKPFVVPMASGKASIGRSIVFGDYMGTNNMVQIADTTGYSVRAGLYLGFDGMNSSQLLNGVLSTTRTVSYTHLKPVLNLKVAFQEPMKRLWVPNIVKNIESISTQLFNSQQAGDQIRAAITKDMTELRKYLDVGESLIITQSLGANEGVGFSIADFASPIQPSLSAHVGGQQLLLHRLHLYRRDENTLLIFKDKGELEGLNIGATISLGYPAEFPIFDISADRIAGSAHSKIYTLNIDADPASNPNLFKTAMGIKSVLKKGSTEILDSVYKPVGLDIDFKDHDSNIRFLQWIRRSMKTTGKIHVKEADGTETNFISLTDGIQKGRSFQLLATQVADYLIQRLAKTGTYSFDAQTSDNPGTTFLGKSRTREVNLQAFTDNNLTASSLDVNYRWQGWSMKSKDVVKLVNQLNEKYGVQFYAPNFMGSADKLQLYRISLDMMIYQAGLTQIMQMTDAQLKAISAHYQVLLQCNGPDDSSYIDDDGDSTNAPPPQPTAPQGPLSYATCGKINRFVKAVKKFRDRTQSNETLAHYAMDAASNAEQFMTFPDFVTLIGGSKNLYVTTQITGFQTGSESYLAPINPNATFGQRDEVYPNGVLDFEQRHLGIDQGEFLDRWMRSTL